jgi:hypothetical protein
MFTLLCALTVPATVTSPGPEKEAHVLGAHSSTVGLTTSPSGVSRPWGQEVRGREADREPWSCSALSALHNGVSGRTEACSGGRLALVCLAYQAEAPTPS